LGLFARAIYYIQVQLILDHVKVGRYQYQYQLSITVAGKGHGARGAGKPHGHVLLSH